MKILNSQLDIGSFLRRLNETSQKVLFLDYDGTLAPFRVEPDKAFPYPGVREMINRLMKAPDIRLIIVTGRWTRDLIPLLDLEMNPEIWGSHGLERFRPDGTYELARMDEDALRGLVAADEWIEKVGFSFRREEKPGSLAIHWRGLDEREIDDIRDQAMSKLSIIAQGWQLHLKEFDGGIELRLPTRNKGDAVRTVLEETDGDGLAAYLGDDITDEDAFAAIKGKGMSVLVRDRLRATAADLWIRPPDELLEFLNLWLPECRSRSDVFLEEMLGS
jgi:trehalose-phosphatase